MKSLVDYSRPRMLSMMVWRYGQVSEDTVVRARLIAYGAQEALSLGERSSHSIRAEKYNLWRTALFRT